MPKYKAELSFELDESPDASIMLQSMQSAMIGFFNLHPHFFRNVHIDLNKEEPSAD